MFMSDVYDMKCRWTNIFQVLFGFFDEFV